MLILYYLFYYFHFPCLLCNVAIYLPTFASVLLQLKYRILREPELWFHMSCFSFCIYFSVCWYLYFIAAADLELTYGIYCNIMYQWLSTSHEVYVMTDNLLFDITTNPLSTTQQHTTTHSISLHTIRQHNTTQHDT